MIAKIGTLKGFALNDWWSVQSATTWAAWQAKGAASLESAKMDLSGNGRNLVGNPTWNKSVGFTSSTIFFALSNIPISISVVAAGSFQNATTNIFRPTSANGLYMQTASGYTTYFSHSATLIPSQHSFSSNISNVLVFTKSSLTQQQQVFHNGVLIGSRSDGTTPTFLQSNPYSFLNETWAMAIYDGVLSNQDILSITNNINSL